MIDTECGISSPMYLSKNESQVKFRSLNQNERLKILQAFQIKKILDRFPELDTNTKLLFNYVINKFYDLFIYAKRDYNEIVRIYDSNSFKMKLEEWLKMYILLAGDENITPYIHAFVYHVLQFIEEYKNLNLFSVLNPTMLNPTSA